MTDRSQSHPQTRFARPGAWLMAASAVGGLIASLIYYFWRGDGIAYTPGTLLVIVSTALLLASSLVMAMGVWRHRATTEFLAVATCLDVLGTAFAAWLLEAHWLLGLMVLAAAGWIINVFFDAQTMTAVRERSSHMQESAR